MQLDDILPEQNTLLQKMVSMSGILSETLHPNPVDMMGGLNLPPYNEVEDADPYFGDVGGPANYANEMNFDSYQPAPREDPMPIQEELKQSEFKTNLIDTQKPLKDSLWILSSDNIDKVTGVECEEKDLIDELDLFYPAAQAPLPGKGDAFLEESKGDEIPFSDLNEHQNQVYSAAVSAFESKVGKFSDVFVAKYNKI